MPNRAYEKGYRFELYCSLTLEYNGFHAVRNYASQGIEDLIGIRKDVTLFIQVKNTVTGKHGMTKEEQLILKKHALEYGAIPIFLYKESRNKVVWLNLLTMDYYDSIKKFTKEWYTQRMEMKRQLREVHKKGKSSYNEYVLGNWGMVSGVVC